MQTKPAKHIEHGCPYCDAEHDPGILDGVMLIDIQIAGGMQLQIESAVLGEQLQHVIQK